MSAPVDSSPPENFEAFPAQTILPAAPPVEHRPMWSVFAALGVWFASVSLLLVTQIAAIIIYVISSYGLSRLPLIASVINSKEDQPAVIFASVLAVIPAHLLTLGLAWMVVTGFGKRPFWSAIGWSWSPRIGFWASAGLAFLLLALGLALTRLLGGGNETQLDQIISSSYRARLATAFLATATAPFIEELVYRGVLYPALQRFAGAIWAVVGVSTLFTLVHVFQYSNNLGVISAIALLSLALTIVRATTGRLLPCFVIHLIFNGVQAASLLAEPYFRQAPDANAPQQAALFFVNLFL